MEQAKRRRSTRRSTQNVADTSERSEQEPAQAPSRKISAVPDIPPPKDPPNLNGGLPNRPWGRKGKAPVADRPVEIEDVDDDDAVEEYQFSSGDEMADAEDEDLLDDDDRSVVSLSSNSSDSEPAFPIEPRPWLRFSDETRKQWEVMYANVTPYAIGGSWAITEEYQREKDEEMLQYLQDFPLTQWLIPPQSASNAWSQLQERLRWRGYGIPIYGRDRVPANSPPPPLLPPQNGNRIQPQQREMPTRPAPNQQQHPNQYMPPPNYQRPLAQQGQKHILPHMVHPRPPSAGMHPLSQPYGQLAMQHGPTNMGRPVGVPQQIPYGMPHPAYPGQPMPPQMAYAPQQVTPKPRRRHREKKETPQATTPPPPPPTPPYAIRQKPGDPRKPLTKPARKNPRRQAEAEEFPWTRKINFAEAKEKANWDDTIYDPKTLADMEATRKRNVRVIDDIDAKLQEQQRVARANKKLRDKGVENSSDAENKKQERKKRTGQPKGESGGDPYHSGAYAWANEEMEKRGKELGCPQPDDAIDIALSGMMDDAQMESLRICWNPGKKGITEGLEQSIFSVRDHVTTRRQLSRTPVLTRRAAECIVDFCPDLLWRGMLLRITSEGGYGNKDVRDRFCLNGCYCDKATITKRISAALGQKQVQPKSKGYSEGEYEWYEENVKDFTHYIEYFGRRTSHRNMLKIQIAGDKRRANMRQLSGAAAESGDEQDGPNKRLKIEDGGRDSGAGGDDDGGDESGEETDDSNAVSLQDSDILDKIDDDD